MAYGCFLSEDATVSFVRKPQLDIGWCAMSRRLSGFEERLMRAMGLTSVDQLDELLAAPISQWAADHSEPPDEEYDLADQMYQEADRQWHARQRFKALSECKYLN
jgi:hypothetical protein